MEVLPVQYGGEQKVVKNVFPLPPLSRVQLEAVGSVRLMVANAQLRLHFHCSDIPGSVTFSPNTM